MDPADVGRALAARHDGETAAGLDPAISLLNYAESSRAGGWSLRSALVRVAQPDPQRVAHVLESVRRCDGALHGLARALERHPAVTDRRLGPGRDPAVVVEPVPDVRVADLARLLPLGPAAFSALLASYQDVVDVVLSTEEQLAIPLLGVALDLDELAETLAEWAVTASGPVPVAAIDATVERTAAALDAMNVPRETGPPPRR